MSPNVATRRCVHCLHMIDISVDDYKSKSVFSEKRFINLTQTPFNATNHSHIDSKQLLAISCFVTDIVQLLLLV